MIEETPVEKRTPRRESLTTPECKIRGGTSSCCVPGVLYSGSSKVELSLKQKEVKHHLEPESKLLVFSKQYPSSLPLTWHRGPLEAEIDFPGRGTFYLRVRVGTKPANSMTCSPAER